MKILVLVKQVPALESVRFLPQINRIEREGVDSLTNPLDGQALEIALGLAGAGDEVVVATMGPPQARAVLEDAIARGAARGVHLVDPMFAGADTLATARAFARLVDRERPDLVLGGRTSIDGATAQVIPQLAELAGLALATEADSVELHDGEVEITRLALGSASRVRASLPAAVSVAAPPTGRALAHAPGGGTVEQLDVDALGGDPAGYGIRGSATYVQAVDVVDPVRAGETVRDPGEGLRRVEALATAGATATVPSLSDTATTPRRADRRAGSGDGDGDGSAAAHGAEIWVVVERSEDEVARVSLEALAAARPVGERVGAAVVALCFGACGAALASRLAGAGADTVLSLHAPDLAPGDPSSLAAALSAAVELRPPLAVLGQWTVAQRDWLARAAARRGLGMTGDVVGLDAALRPGSADVLDLVWLKPAWSGAALARVVARTVPSFGTLRPGAQDGLERPDRYAPTVRLDLGPLDVDAGRSSRVVDAGAAGAAGAADLQPDGARVLVLVGRGLGVADSDTAGSLARRLGAAFARVPGAEHADGATTVSAATHALSPHLAVVFGSVEPADLVPVRLAKSIVSVGEAIPGVPVDLALLVAPAAMRIALDGAPEH
ncbi:MAG TPA: hypothetical protein VMV02_04950 [Acidimicrobiales bacterium]|nr:hypothetical protein [Acidimicrobiales bacterium]